ncbi:hypothetical protein [Sulfuritalea sp.]|uniref:hypothetical protein n=1 Tax=Sulfuritalea sp. TaxID=2480090 RepID=UPI001ACB1A0E|nr:hypothetical protein [Sulfuritalea sp.]MBN8474407.1 hypothetical protein [Sulfuritalea sp.]
MKTTTRESLRHAKGPIPLYGDGVILGGGPATPAGWTRPSGVPAIALAASDAPSVVAVTSYPGGRTVVQYSDGTKAETTSPALAAANSALTKAAKEQDAAARAYEAANAALSAAVAMHAPRSAAKAPTPAAAPAPAPAAASASAPPLAAAAKPVPPAAPRPAPAAAPPEPSLPSPAAVFAERAAVAAAAAARRTAPGSTDRKTAAPSGDSFAALANRTYSERNRNV